MDRKRLWTGLGIAVLCGLFLAMFVNYEIRKASIPAPVIVMKQIVVAAGPLPLGTVLTSKDLRVIPWPSGAPVANMFSRGMIALQSEIGQAITDHLLERQRQISASLDARKAMLAETAAGREAARSEAQRNLQSIARLRERAERLLEDISASQGAPVVARGA